MKKLFLLALASLWCGQAAAATHSVICNGCDVTAMYDAAARATTKGTVYVFDARDGDARKFKVETEIITLKPYWAATWGDELPIELDVKTAFSKFVTAEQTRQADDRVVLPPDFPIRSVAGAFIEPGAAAIRITDYLRHVPTYERLVLTVNAFTTSLLKNNIPGLKLSDLLQYTKVLVEFADGSTLEYEIYFSVNAMNAMAELELRPLGNARLYDGTPAPTSSYGFRDFVTVDSTSSVYEWVMWAKMQGIPVYDGSGGKGTSMVCSISGSNIRCAVSLLRP